MLILLVGLTAWVLAVLAWVLAVLVIRLFVAGASQPLSREQTERLRAAAHEALRQIERRNVLVVLKPSEDRDPNLVGRD